MNTKVKKRNVFMSVEQHEVLVDGKSVDMPQAEFELLRCLMFSGGRVLSRDYLRKELGISTDETGRTIDTYIVRLRKKVPNRIKTVPGYGYKWN